MIYLITLKSKRKTAVPIYRFKYNRHMLNRSTRLPF